MKKFIIYLITIIMVLTGCSSIKKTDDLMGEKVNDLEEIDENILETYLFTDKVITWIIPEAFNINFNVLKNFNKRLLEKGYDFNLNIVMLDYMNYHNELNAYLEENNTADVIFAGFDNRAYQYVKDGFFINLDTYLKSSQGQELFQLFDAILWDTVKVDNKIYSIPGGALINPGITFAFNKNYVRENDIKNFSGHITELEEILNKIPGKEDFSHMIYNLDGIEFTQLLDCDFVYGSLLLDNDRTGAYSPFSLEKSKVIFRKFNDYYKKGYITYDCSFNYNVNANSKQQRQMNELLKNDSYVVYITSPTDHLLNDKNVITVTTKGYVRSRIEASTGIYKNSKYKDEAFTLLSLIHTDKEFTNLLMYGIEDEDYKLKDGFVYDMEGNPYNSGVKDMFLGLYENVYPIESEGAIDRITHKKEYYNKNVIVSPYLGYNFDNRGYESIIEKVNKIVLDNLDIWKSNDIEEEFKRVNTALEEAGMNQLIEAINEQFHIKN